ncbi:hypothetical protein AB9F29_20730 [Falsihalocynthiibacter sp. S25ZX9]|uniref:hypothetical protein n=1 Tax=Falsihalocynthiibacter sp. S25ZX9 TaxID=3240870 RepID=UPI00350EE51A
MHVSYLPFKNLHFAEITDIDPDSLKKASEFARRQGRDVEPIGHSTTLNFIAKSLGVKAGWSGYQKEYRDSIAPFLEENRLLRRQDILKQDLNDQFHHFSSEQISGRLFNSGRPLPDKMFIGDGFNYWDLLDLAVKHPKMHVETSMGDHIFQIDRSGIPNNYQIHMNDGKCDFTDASVFSNFLGDQLCKPPEEEPVACLYRLDETARSDLKRAGEILSILLQGAESGWAEVIPYNKNLVFLRLDDGRYDFFFKNMRHQKFARNPYLPYLRDKDISKKSRSDDFSVWSYFQYDGWKELDVHKANVMCLGTVSKPSMRIDVTGEAFLKEYLIDHGRYQLERHEAPARKGYHYKSSENGGLCFTDLVTIKKFDRFLAENPDYARHREGLEDVGNFAGAEYEPDDLPAAVTWYDALAYASWRRGVEKLPLRLLEVAQFVDLTDGLQSLAPEHNEEFTYSHAEFPDRPFTFYDPENEAYLPEIGRRPDYMPEGEFKKWTLRYSQKTLLWGTSNFKLEVVRSPWFSEWLAPKGQAINTWGFCPPQDIMFAHRYAGAYSSGSFAPTSDGKYKSMKIGFRLCYKVFGSEGFV